MPRVLIASQWLALVLGVALPAPAQIPGFSVSKQFRLERLGEGHWRATGQVEMQRDDQQFFADVVDFYTETDRLVASGKLEDYRVIHQTWDKRRGYYRALGFVFLGTGLGLLALMIYALLTRLGH